MLRVDRFHLLSLCHLGANTNTYFWRWDWRFCELDCPRCWQQYSCRSLRQLVWRPAKSVLALALGHWGEEGRGNATTSPWEKGNLHWSHRLGAHPAQDPPPLCRSLTAGSWGELVGKMQDSGREEKGLQWVNLCGYTEQNHVVCLYICNDKRLVVYTSRCWRWTASLHL